MLCAVIHFLWTTFTGSQTATRECGPSSRGLGGTATPDCPGQNPVARGGHRGAYQSLTYRTTDSWSCSRRVVCQLTYDAKGARRHFVVTSVAAERVSAGQLHADYYCPRGEMENRIKEHQLDLFSDRTSTHDARK